MSSDPHAPDPSPSEKRASRNPVGLGAPIALLILVCVIVGGLLGQPSIGLLTGVGLGIVIAILGARK